MYPNPIVFHVTPSAGLTLAVTASRGGLTGYVLLGLEGAPASVQLQAAPGAPWTTPTYPHTLAAGETLWLTRTDTSPALSTLLALAPPDEGDSPGGGGEPFVFITDPDGYQTITNAEATTDAEGDQTIPDATASADPDGYESVERTP